ncbi:MAG: hypothetical protein IKZ20_07515 [Bacteroidaceae bacterium]|nr:hypothetical protein [Bacteroidaceae bacterium]
MPKNIIKFLSLAAAILLFHSCTTSQTISITGTPGTEIYTPDKDKIAVIPATGKAKVRIPGDVYYAYFMSHQVGSNEFVPFALDFNRCNYAGKRAARILSYPAAALGAIMVGLGAANTAGEEDGSLRGPFIGGGTIITAAGITGAIALHKQLKQTQLRYRYKYLSSQSTNEDFTFTHPIDNGFIRTVKNEPQRSETQVENSEGTPAATSTAARRRGKTSTATRNLRDNGKQVAGTYVGTGRLLLNGEEVESYTDIKVVVKRIDENNVLVEVYESGEAFFNTGDKYSIKKASSGKFTLSLKGIPSATITISKNKNMVYLHPKVNIEGEIYTLEIKASLQE